VEAWRVIVSIAAAFALGSVPFAVITSRLFFRTDIRNHGSGNPGATNVLRVHGVPAGVGVLVFDFAKGVAGVLVARVIVAPYRGDPHDWVLVAAALAAIAGHSFSPFIGFRGGKGVATGAGTIAILMPGAFAVMAATFGVTLAIARTVSLSSVLLAFELPVLMLVIYGDRTPLVLFGIAAAAFVLWRHHANIKRILRGEEARIGAPRMEEVRS